MRASDPPFDDTVFLDDMSGKHNTAGEFEPDTEPIVDSVNSNHVPDAKTVTGASRSCSSTRAYATVAVMLFVNLLNYMDRYTIAGVLSDILKYYKISDSEGGLLQTSFIISYMLLSPLFGYLGDRYNRKVLMTFGIVFWAGITLASSFIPSSMFGLFLAMRALVGLGEASYSTIAPTIIADLFVKDQRTRMLALFYFAIPVGSGMGYIAGTYFAQAFGNWQYALRLTPGLGIIAAVLIMLVVHEPERGESEGGTKIETTTVKLDLIYLARNKSFVLTTIGFTCVAFVTGALAFWAPVFMLDAIASQGKPADKGQVSLIFGLITCIAGFLGVGIGSEVGRRLKKKYPNADPLVCAFGLISCSPFLFLAAVFANKQTELTWVLIFVGEVLLCLNWALVTDVLLYVVIPTRRSTAEAVQILTSHLFGDAGSPYLMGVVADQVRGVRPKTPNNEFQSLQKALYMTVFVAVLGGAGFLATSLYVKEDRARADSIIRAGLESEEDVQDGRSHATGQRSAIA